MKPFSRLFNRLVGKNRTQTEAIHIETPRLVLREHKPEDLGRILEMTSKPGFYYYCFDGTKEKVDAFLKKSIDSRLPDPHTKKREDVMLAIEIKGTGELVGHVSIEKMFYLGNKAYEINFFVDPACQNKGYGREAAVNLMRFGLEDLEMPGYTVTAHPENGASKHVIYTEGYVKIGDTTMETTNGVEPREVFLLTKDAFYKVREKDKKPMLLPRAPKP